MIQLITEVVSLITCMRRRNYQSKYVDAEDVSVKLRKWQVQAKRKDSLSIRRMGVTSLDIV